MCNTNSDNTDVKYQLNNTDNAKSSKVKKVFNIEDYYSSYYILWIIVIVLCTICIFLLWDKYYGDNLPKVMFIHKTTDTMAYDLFDKQFTHLLVTISLLATVFGLAIPVISFFFQRQSLTIEREAISKEFERSLNEVKQQTQKYNNKVDTLDTVIAQKINNDLTPMMKDLEKKTSELEVKITKTEEHLSENKNYLFFTIGYFCEHLAFEYSKTNETMAFTYYLNAAERFSFLTTEISRITDCLGNACIAVGHPSFDVSSLYNKNVTENILSLKTNTHDNPMAIRQLTLIEETLRSKGFNI